MEILSNYVIRAVVAHALIVRTGGVRTLPAVEVR
jgi:hypothetical protein